MSTERKLYISIISGNRELKDTLSDLIMATQSFVSIRLFNFENSFFENSEETDMQTDLVICDRSDKTSGWSEFHSRLAMVVPDALLIFIIPDNDREINIQMIKEGVFDLLSSSTLRRIQPLLHRISQYIDDRSKMRFLAREKEFSDQISNHSRSMLSIINRNYVYDKVNATFCNAHNIKVESIVGKSLTEVWGKDTFNGKIKQNIDLCFQGNTVRYEANFDTPLFGNRYYEVVFRPIQNEDGEITHLLAETFDITDIKLSRQIVAEMEEEFKKLETNLPIGFVRCETDGTIIHTNRAFHKIIGCSEDEPISGLNIREFYTEKGLFDIHFRQLQSEKIKTFGRVPLFTCTGSEIVCRISGFIVTSESGHASFIDFAFEDSSRELMLENRLLQAQKLETIGALAGGLAHDFNNILTTISGYSEILQEEIKENPVASEKVTKIMSAVTKARSLTGQILTFSRQVEQEKIPVSIKEVLLETLAFAESGKPENIEIRKNIADVDTIVLSDPTQLFRVFLNLMTNGIQAMEQNSGALTVSLSIVEGCLVQHELNRSIVADEYALVTIEDTGIGMEPSVMQRIFEPYFTTKEVGKGTGLGLSVVHGIVSEMEGEMLVSSKKDKGSVFSLYLPVTSDYTKDMQQESSAKRLLFITGNSHESRILLMALEKSGFTIEVVSDISGIKGAFSKSGKKPEMILYMDDSEDIKPDDLVGFYSIATVSVPLILITDSDHFQSKEKLLNSGIAKQVLLKPVSLKEIHNAIQLALI